MDIKNYKSVIGNSVKDVAFINTVANRAEFVRLKDALEANLWVLAIEFDGSSCCFYRFYKLDK